MFGSYVNVASTSSLARVIVRKEVFVGRVVWGIPTDFVDAIQRSYPLSRAVESGTYQGESAVLLAKRFDEVITIEGDNNLALAAARRLAGYPGVRVVQGDSREVLPAIVKGLDAPALFWLDSHYCGRGTYGADWQCPVIEEIGAVASSDFPHVMLIDDARLFLTPPPRVLKTRQWPSVNDIFRLIERGNVRRHILIHDDVIAAIPLDMFPPVEAWLLDIADSRFAAEQRLPLEYLRRLRKRLGGLVGRFTGPG